MQQPSSRAPPAQQSPVAMHLENRGKPRHLDQPPGPPEFLGALPPSSPHGRNSAAAKTSEIPAKDKCPPGEGAAVAEGVPGEGAGLVAAIIGEAPGATASMPRPSCPEESASSRERGAAPREGESFAGLRREELEDDESRRRRRRPTPPPPPAGRRRSGTSLLRQPPISRHHRDADRIRKSPLHGRNFNDRSRRFHHDEIHGCRNPFRARTPGRQPKRRIVPALHSIGMQRMNPAPFIQNMFSCFQFPDMCRNAPDLNVDHLRQGHPCSILETGPTSTM
ncbi:hypothetical protein PVAP13_3KG358054 [Panicum virgatum]|uniref:Uncharacterized protein n=1 Tax=Panicum virgatum TaxID=38727 RepID=A0A8T0UZA7_PANVG|nr:hypothetical protein PVAP13_3KG358054 [Panicum virgatum]